MPYQITVLVTFSTVCGKTLYFITDKFSLCRQLMHLLEGYGIEYNRVDLLRRHNNKKSTIKKNNLEKVQPT